MDLQSLYQDIRKRYFPRWDSKRNWEAHFGSPEQLRNNSGYCDTAIKTLFFDRKTMEMMSEEGARAFVIHEICHDTGAAFHNRAWAERIEKAASTAEGYGETEVAAILLSDIESYAGTGVLEEFNSENVREYVDELFWAHGVRESQPAIIRVARYFGHAPAKVRRDFGELIQHELMNQH